MELQSLHEIDKPNGTYTDEELEKFAVFCLLDRAMPYAKVCSGFDALNSKGLTTKKALKSVLSNPLDFLRVSNAGLLDSERGNSLSSTKERMVGFRHPIFSALLWIKVEGSNKWLTLIQHAAHSAREVKEIKETYG